MARWSSWFVASLVLALLFVTSDCLRGSNTHIVDQETPIGRIRGSSRFSTAKVEKKWETTPEAFTVRSRSNRRGNSVTTRVNDSTKRPNKSLGDTVTHTTSEKSTIQQSSNLNRRRTGFSSRRHSEQSSDLTRAATEDRRYLPEPSSRKFTEQIDDNTDLQVPHEPSRTNDRQSNGSLRSRSSVRTAARRIDTTVPSASASDVPRSRTGRKIQPTLPPRDFAVSNKYSSSSIASDNARGSIESREQTRTTSKLPSRRITERSTQRHDILSNSNQINTPTEIQAVTTTISPREINVPRSRNITDNQNSNKSRGSSSSLRSNRRGVVKATVEREESRKKLSEDSETSAKRRESESITSITDKSPRYRGRSLSVDNITIDKKQRREEPSRSIKKSKTPDLNNDIGGLSSRTRSRARFVSDPTNITQRSRVNHHTTTVKYTMTTDVDSENTTIVFSPSETIETVTNLPVTVSTVSVTPTSSPRAPKALSNTRKAAASSLSIKTLPKEDFFNHGLGFRGRKFNPNVPQTTTTAIDTRNNEITTAKPHGNPGWTLQRRPSFKKEASGDTSSTVSTITNEIPSSNDGKSTLSKGNRRRGGQTFNKASVLLKIDREVDESDNYPPEFKAKIAELKNPGVKDGGSKSSSGVGKDDDPLRHVVVINHRQSRSTDNAKREETESYNYPEVITINPITPVPELPNDSEMLDGQKKFTPRSRQKSSSTRRSDSVRISSTSPTSTLSVNSVESVEHTSLRASKRQSSFSRTSTTTPRAFETITLPKVDRKIGRTSTSIERGNVRVGETIHLRQNRKGSIVNPILNDSVTTTVNPVEESSERLKNQENKFRNDAARSNNLSNGFTSTTRKSRAWNAVHIDRDWQEPTTVSSTDKNVVLSTSTKRSRVWNIKYIDKNWQEPLKTSEDQDKTLSTTEKSILNIKNTRKSIGELRTDKSTSSTTEMSELSLAQPRRREFRPRTATYRRHSEISPVAIPQLQNVENLASVAITPRYHASIKVENVSQQSVRQEPSLALQISNVTMTNNSTNSTGISLSNRGTSGNSDSNIFNPTKTTFLINSNVSLLEQLRSTVAPLLGVLGAKSPIFSGVYQNAINSSSNEQRVTPSGSPPRFSARYRGAELLVRKPNVIDSSGLSPTTPLTSIQNENSSSMVSVSSPGEPKVLTFYQAFETASIKNELVRNDSNSQSSQREQQQPEQSAGAQVDTSSVVTDLNFNGSSNANNDTTTSSTTTTTTTETILINLEPIITTVNSLTMVMDTQTPDTSSNQSSDLTQTPDVSTTMPSTNGPVEMITDLMNPQPNNDSSVDNSTTPQLIMETLLTTTESISTISTTEMEIPTTTDGTSTSKRAMEIIMGDLMETTTVQETSSVMEMTTTSESMTIGTENMTMETTTIVPMTENIPMNVTDQTEMSMVTTPITTEITTDEIFVTTQVVAMSNEPMIIMDDNSNSTKTLEILAQFGNATTSQVMDEEIIGTTVISINETDDATTEITLMDSDATTIIPLSVDTNSTEVDADTITEVPDSIDEALLSQMMKRLMDLFSLDDFDPQLRNNSKSDELGRVLGGFLDNSDRNTPIEITTMPIPIETTQQIDMSVTTQIIQDNIISLENLSTEQNDIVSTTEAITQTSEPQNTSTNSETTQTIDQLLNNDEMTSQNLSNIESTTILNENKISQLVDETTLTPTTTEMQLVMTTGEITTITNTQIETTTINVDTNTTTNTVSEAIDTTLVTQIIETTTPNVEVIDNSSVTTIRADDSEIMNNSTPITSTLIPTTNDPNIIAGFQDTTPPTAQRTAGSDVTTQPSSTISLPSSIPELTTIAQSIITNATTLTQSSSSSSPSSSPSSTPPSSTTTVMLAAASVTTTPATTQTESTTAQSTTSQATTESMMSTSTPSTTTVYLGRFGGSRITPAPRFSSSSSTRMPLRDYHVYGIYPNKTIVRKRPEDNLIDARNIDSPYVIFGIYPDGKLVRKFPNGTVIPDPPSNPVEVVFSLSTSTTTNRPQFPQQYNMFNQGTINNNNQNAASINNRPMDIIFNDGQKNGYRSQLNIGLSGNSLSLNGDGPNQIAAPNLIPGMGNVGTQTSATTMITDANSMPSQTSGPPSGVTPSSVNPQGGRIIQDIERDKASRTKEAGGQRSTVYIGQEKFINYWSDNGSQNESQVLSVNINSKTNALNVGPNPGSIPNLDIITNEQDQSRVTAPPGFPWKDPLDQIFGITTELPIGPSIASNTLDDPSPSRSAITDRTINPLVEVFTPMLNGAQLARDTSSTSSATTNVPSTPSSTIQTTTTTTTTTTSTTTRPTTTLPPQTTSPPTQTTTPVTTATLKPSTTELPFATQNLPQQTAFGSTFDDLAFLNSLLQSNQHSNSISSTPKTLTEVEQLLANKILSLALGKPGPTRSPKAIQSSNVSPNSLDGFTSFGNSQPIIIDLLRSTTTKPKVSSTATTQYTWRPIPTTVPITTSYKPAVDTTLTTTTTTEKNEIITKPATTSTSTTDSIKLTTQLPTTTTVQSTWKPISTNPPTTNPPQIITTIQTTQKPLNRKPVTVKPTQKPRPITTTQQPLGFGAGLLQAIFGRNIFAPPPTQRPLSNTRRPVATTKKIVQTTVKPISTTRAVESKVTTVKSTSTFSPEDDAKFLLRLLNAANKDGKEEGNRGGSSAVTLDDEKFLRAILSGEAKVRTPAPSTNNAVTLNNAALLAELLKAEGIEPTTPINRLREQLHTSATTKPSMSTERPRTVGSTPRKVVTTRPRTNERTPTSTYPPPLFSNFNFGLPRGQITSEETSNDSVSTRNQVLNAAIGATRLFSQFLGSAITGAAQQLQSFVKNGTRYVSEVVG